MSKEHPAKIVQLEHREHVRLTATAFSMFLAYS